MIIAPSARNRRLHCWSTGRGLISCSRKEFKTIPEKESSGRLCKRESASPWRTSPSLLAAASWAIAARRSEISMPKGDSRGLASRTTHPRRTQRRAACRGHVQPNELEELVSSYPSSDALGAGAQRVSEWAAFLPTRCFRSRSLLPGKLGRQSGVAQRVLEVHQTAASALLEGPSVPGITIRFDPPIIRSTDRTRSIHHGGTGFSQRVRKCAHAFVLHRSGLPAATHHGWPTL
jgi:hypothetical protein